MRAHTSVRLGPGLRQTRFANAKYRWSCNQYHSKNQIILQFIIAIEFVCRFYNSLFMQKYSKTSCIPKNFNIVVSNRDCTNLFKGKYLYDFDIRCNLLNHRLYRILFEKLSSFIIFEWKSFQI